MKCGLKTFPLSVDLDDGVKLVEAEFGVKGYAVVIKLFQAIFSRGYYMKWDIDTELLFIRDYCLSEVGRNLVSEIVACCIRRGVFESTLFDKYQILTSKRIQETFLSATRRNTQVLFEKEYALPVVYTFIENARESGKTVNIFFKNDDIVEQNKGKENKEKDKKGKEEEKKYISSPSAREQTPYARFLDRWGISDKNLSNYNAGKVSGIDWDKMSEEVERSKFLQDAVTRGITFFINQSGRIMDGEFRDRPKRHQETDAAKVYTTLREKYKQEEELNYASHKDVPS